jgi:hypothetical protein
MKKTAFSEDEIKTIIRLYTDDKFGMAKIGKLYDVSKSAIRTLLHEQGIQLDTPGQRFRGGKSAADKRYAEKHKNEIAEYNAKWQKENRDALRAYHTEWRNQNRPHVRKYARDKFTENYRNNPIFRLTHNMRFAVWAALKERGGNKRGYRTFQILPYTVEQLKAHLEPLFQAGMTWDNYGEWHVDHKKPISSFNFSSHKDPDFQQCWALDNLQPLWGEENWSKGSKITELAQEMFAGTQPMAGKELQILNQTASRLISDKPTRL